jgi:16S rRNA (guanine1207-N2)-methyltransferase
MTAYDVDARAVEACRKNTKMAAGRVECVWQDLTQLPTQRDFDFIVMNPPFHEGAAAQSQLGINFIKTAAFCLKPGGHLYMVANTHLPYEEALKALFAEVRPINQGKGFKIIKATR